jgi:hypothetical protein
MKFVRQDLPQYDGTQLRGWQDFTDFSQFPDEPAKTTADYKTEKSQSAFARD